MTTGDMSEDMYNIDSSLALSKLEGYKRNPQTRITARSMHELNYLHARFVISTNGSSSLLIILVFFSHEKRLVEIKWAT